MPGQDWRGRSQLQWPPPHTHAGRSSRLPQDGPSTNGWGLVQHKVRQQGQCWIALVAHTRVDYAAAQQCSRLQRGPQGVAHPPTSTPR